MKLALIGTHGVGKTTLAFEVCAQLKIAGYSVELVTEIARRSPFPVNEGTTLESQLWILHQQIAQELEATPRAQYVVCDRAVIDNYAYLANKFDRQYHLEPMLSQWLRTYDLLIYIPLRNGDIQADGFRSENMEFQRTIDLRVRGLVRTSPFAERLNELVDLEVAGVSRERYADYIVKEILPRHNPYLPTQSLSSSPV
ncbi:MAG: AAA family ATPase [Acidobacteriia bacterium]|nr:AAA family ATPase [Terriglobia bacterium]